MIPSKRSVAVSLTTRLPGFLIVPSLLVNHLDVGEVDQFFSSTRRERAFVDFDRHHLPLLAALPKTLYLLLELRGVDFTKVGVGQESARCHLGGLLGLLFEGQRLRLARCSVVAVVNFDFLFVARMEDIFPVAFIFAFGAFPFLPSWDFSLGLLGDGINFNDLSTFKNIGILRTKTGVFIVYLVPTVLKIVQQGIQYRLAKLGNQI